MTFFGEAVPIDWTNNITSGPPSFGNTVRYLGDGTTYAAASGDDWMVGFYDYDYLQETSVAEYFLVFEVLSGSGSVSISWGFDPEWDLDPAVATTAAGTHPIVTGINAIALTGVDVGTYWTSDEELTVHVEVASGSFVVDQVRLRVWPPGGPVGAMSEVITPTTVETRQAYFEYRSWVGSASAATFADAQTASRTASAAAALSTYSSNSGTGVDQWGPGSLWMRQILGASSSATQSTIDSPPGGASTGGLFIRIYMSASDPVPPGANGVDWIKLPDDTDYRIEQMDDPEINWGAHTQMAFFHSGGILTGGGPTADTEPTVHTYSGPGPFYVQAQEGHDLVKPTVAGGDAVVFTPAGAQPSTFFDGDFSSWELVRTLDLASLTSAAAEVSVTIFPESYIAYEEHIGVTPYSEVGPPLYSHLAGSAVTPVIGDGDPDPARRNSLINYEPLEYTFIRAPFRYWDPSLVSEPEPETTFPPAGYLMNPDPNLTGLEDRVDVNFG